MNNQPHLATLVQQWIEEDEQLSKVLVDIEESGLLSEEQAEMAFHRISDMYGLPKMPDDIEYNDEDDDEEPTSVYQELGLIKYLAPKDDDPRGLVLLAIYFVKNRLHADESEIDKSSISGIGYRGENSEVELVLVQKGQSWVELGCKLFTKTV